MSQRDCFCHEPGRNGHDGGPPELPVSSCPDVRRQPPFVALLVGALCLIVSLSAGMSCCWLCGYQQGFHDGRQGRPAWPWL